MPYLFSPVVPLKKPVSISDQMGPISGIREISAHHPDLFLSCHRLTMIAKASQSTGIAIRRPGPKSAFENPAASKPL